MHEPSQRSHAINRSRAIARLPAKPTSNSLCRLPAVCVPWRQTVLSDWHALPLPQGAELGGLLGRLHSHLDQTRIPLFWDGSASQLVREGKPATPMEDNTAADHMCKLPKG